MAKNIRKHINSSIGKSKSWHMMEYYPILKIMLQIDQNIIKYLFYITKNEQDKNVSQLYENYS